MTTAAAYTFGIEIETTAPVANMTRFGLQIGPRHRGIQVPYLPAGWKAEHDSSIQHPDHRIDCEIVSPILSGADGIAQLIQVCQALEAHGHKVNASCGVHVHVGWKTDEIRPAAMARLIAIVAYAEKGLYAITGTHHRERGIYAKSVRQYGNASNAKNRLTTDRYHLLNLTNLSPYSKRTVEFRGFSGSTNATKLVGWVMVCLGIVERACIGQRAPTWNPRPLTGGWAAGGEGASEAERLMGYLAWGPGYARTHDGVQFGWISNAIDQDAIKAEFRRLARKYDADVTQ